MTRFEAPRGTQDILPSEQPLWQWVRGTMEELCHAYGYRRIDTPGIEDTELIIRTSGGGSDACNNPSMSVTIKPCVESHGTNVLMGPCSSDG